MLLPLGDLHYPTISDQSEDWRSRDGRSRASALTARYVDVYRHDPVAPSDHTITVVIEPATVRATPHTDHPSRLGHLVVRQAHCRCHLVGQGAGNNHDISLAWRSSEDDPQAILVVSWHRGVNHFDAAACQSESYRPQGALLTPVSKLVYTGEDVLGNVGRFALAGK